MGRAPIRVDVGSYRVVIEGLWGSSRTAGSIAIDDIVFFDGACSGNLGGVFFFSLTQAILGSSYS